MNCKKIQNFILTDYIDAGLKRDLIEEHLVYCHVCRNFLIDVQKIVNSLKNAQQYVPDPFLWGQIEQRIAEEQAQQIEKSWAPDFWERLRAVAHIPRPAFALGTILTMIFVIGSAGQMFFMSPVVKTNGQDQVAYITSLINDPVSNDSGNDGTTPIEQYFL